MATSTPALYNMIKGGGDTLTVIENANIVLETELLRDGVILVDGGRIAAVGKRGEIAIPADVPEDLRYLYVKKGFGVEHNANTQEEWNKLYSHDMADLLAAELSAMAPMHQLMQRMRAKADYAQAQQVREREAQQREAAKLADVPTKVVVRSAEEFEF